MPSAVRAGRRRRLRGALRPALLVRERVLLHLPFTLRYLRARVSATLHRESLRTVLFYPGRPNPHHVAYKLFKARGWRISRDPTAACDFAIGWRYAGAAEPEPALRAIAERTFVLNLEFTDNSKRRVDAAAAEAFGHDIRIDPLTFSGPAVRKSDENARHDGTIVVCPIPVPDAACVYQRVVDNRVADGMVEDIRLPVFGGVVPFGYRKFRPLTDRFSNENACVEIAPIGDLLSEDELLRFLAFCRAVGLDWGEVDVLRDRGNGRLYVVDANATPYGPPNHLPKHEAARAMAMLGEAFDRAFGERIRGE